MGGKHARKSPRLLVFRAAVIFVLALIFSVSSLSTVMANTVSAHVIDGDASYTFEMDSADLGRILAQAEKEGLAPLGPLDVAEQVDNTTTVNIRRGVRLTVEDGDARVNVIAYRGDTVARTLQENNIVVKENDGLEPGPETIVTEGLSIRVLHDFTVKVIDDGGDAGIRSLSFTKGTVADALDAAGIVLGESDSVNFAPEESLYDNMSIRVSRAVTVTVTEGEESRVLTVAARTVRAALAQAGISLNQGDKLNVSGGAKPTEGMEIVITRMETAEVTEREEVDYPTRYLTSDELYEDETELRTEGVKGVTEHVYLETYDHGELVSRELLRDEVIQEPVAEVIVRGTRSRETGETVDREDPEPEETPPELPADEQGNAAETLDGAPSDYLELFSGVCTAYTAADTGSNITATGVEAHYGHVAVNPNLIPYGSLLYITSPGGDVVYGYATAVDTGGGVMRGDLLADLYYETTSECINFGRRTMLVYVLRWGY